MTSPAADAADAVDAPDGSAVASGMTSFPTVLGPCGIAFSARGICAVELPGDNAESTLAALARKRPGLPETSPPPSVYDVIDRITRLLAGATRDDLVDVVLDYSDVSETMQRIYTATRQVPPGSTRTYGEIAAAVGNPGLARAVGRAMGANPFPIIVPCHRVTGADGAVGGFSAPGGAVTKRRMLLAEGVAEQDGPALFGPEELYSRSETSQ